MSHTYSTYEAKAKFSEVLRRVREGQTVTISYHGKPVAEMRPVPAAVEDLEGRLRRLEVEGVLARAVKRRGKLGVIAKKPGALKRFLSDRNT